MSYDSYGHKVQGLKNNNIGPNDTSHVLTNVIIMKGGMQNMCTCPLFLHTLYSGFLIAIFITLGLVQLCKLPLG